MAKNIMICDDAAFMRMLLKDTLTKNGYNVIAQASDGRDAVEKYKESMPDLILMDIAMPGMDGIQALKEILKLNADAQVIMLSTKEQQALVAEALQSGARNFVEKPFQPAQLLKPVKKIIG